MDISLDFVRGMMYAVGIGVLMGLERSMVTALQGRDGADDGGEAKAPSTAEELIGIRTFTILSLGGYTAGLVAHASPAVAAVLMTGMLALVVAMYFRTPALDPGITTEAAAVCACGLGMLSASHPEAAGVVALLITVALACKRVARQTVRQLRRVELTDALKFLVIILIILPLLPDRALDPYGIVNPYKVGLLVVLISGISFVGYFLAKFLGAERGLGLTGLLGGLTSSTAVTAAMAGQARRQPHLIQPCAFATVVANATMFARVLVVVALLNRALVARLVWSIGAMLLVAGVLSLALWTRSRRQTALEDGDVELDNPFSLWPAVKFAGFFVLILGVAKAAQTYLGNRGLYLAALVSGLADVDAITLTIAQQTRAEQLAFDVGALAITIAVVSNSAVKTGIAVYSGGWRFGRLVGLCLFLATGAGLAVALIF